MQRECSVNAVDGPACIAVPGPEHQAQVSSLVQVRIINVFPKDKNWGGHNVFRWQDALWTQCFGDGRFARSAKKNWTVTILWSGFAPDVHATTPVPPMHATAENRVLWKLFFGERITFCVLDERHIARG